MINFKEKWAAISAKKKRLLIWGGILLILIPTLALMMPETRVPKSRTATNDRVISSVLTDSDTTGVSQNAIAARLRALGETLDKTNAQLATLTKSVNMEEINKRLAVIETQQRTANLEREQLKKRIDTGVNALPYSTTSRSKDVYTPPKADKAGNVQEANPTEQAINSGTLQRVYQHADAPNPADFSAAESTSKGKGNKENTPVIPDIVSISEDIPDDVEDPDDDPQFQTYLPATAIMSGVFISGMDAPTSQNARKDPYPALVRIKKDAILPNRFRADIRECGLLAAGFGELSSERAYFRSEVITCIRDDGAIFESPIDSYAVGEDGKAGVRGRLVTKQGQYLAKALTAGFLQAASQLFSVKSIPTINVNRGDSNETTTPYQQVMSSTAMQGAAIAGVGGALERLADIYMKMAGDLFPVIEIDPGRSVDFIVQKGVTLKFTRVTPNGKGTPTSFDSKGRK